MKSREIMKKVFDNKFNKEDMRKDIIYKKNKHKYMALKYAIPLVLVIVLCLGVIGVKNHDIIVSAFKKVDNSNIININKLSKLGSYLFDADIKEIPNNGINIPWFDIFNGINIPKDLDKFNGYSIYTRNNIDNEYDILNCYVYSYFNDNDQSIRIAFSDTYEPIRDYYFSDESGKYSTINEFKLKIYQYNNSYMTEFKYKDYNFDIETRDISKVELINLLESIIK